MGNIKRKLSHSHQHDDNDDNHDKEHYNYCELVEIRGVAQRRDLGPYRAAK